MDLASINVPKYRFGRADATRTNITRTSLAIAGSRSTSGGVGTYTTSGDLNAGACATAGAAGASVVGEIVG